MSRALKAGAVYFATVFVAGFGLGIVRTILLEPALGAVLAVGIELPVILAIAWAICRGILVRWPMRPTPAAVMGAIAFVLLLLAEAAISLVSGRGIAAHLALYARPADQLGLAGQIAFALLPIIQAKRAARQNG